MDGIFVPLKNPYKCPACEHIGRVYRASCNYMGPGIIEFICDSCGYKWKQSAEYINKYTRKSKKEATIMKVTYNGFTGELVKLEKTFCQPSKYDLSLYDSEKQATISFTGVKLEDVRFRGGEVTFGE